MNHHFPAENQSDDSLQSEIHSSLRNSRKSSKNESQEVSDNDYDIPLSGSSAYRRTLRTYKAIAKSSPFSKNPEAAKEDSSKEATDGEGFTFQVITPNGHLISP